MEQTQGNEDYQALVQTLEWKRTSRILRGQRAALEDQASLRARKATLRIEHNRGRRGLYRIR